MEIEIYLSLQLQILKAFFLFEVQVGWISLSKTKITPHIEKKFTFGKNSLNCIISVTS